MSSRQNYRKSDSSPTVTSPRINPRTKSGSLSPNALFDRHKSLRHKLDLLRIKHRLKEFSTLQRCPKINPTSNKTTKSSNKSGLYSPTRMQMTQEIISKSRFMPKNVKLSIVSLMSPRSALAPASMVSPSSSSLSVLSSRVGISQHYPSLSIPSKSNESIEKFPSDIEKRNELLFSLREETINRFEVEPDEPPDGDIAQRSKKWLLNKKKRLEMQRSQRDLKSLDGCTFKPALSTKRFNSLCKSSRTRTEDSSLDLKIPRKPKFRASKSNASLKFIKPNFPSKSNISLKFLKHSMSSVSSPRSFANEKPHFTLSPYSGITPLKMRVAYESGYSGKLKTKSQPMINYKNLYYEH